MKAMLQYIETRLMQMMEDVKHDHHCTWKSESLAMVESAGTQRRHSAFGGVAGH